MKFVVALLLATWASISLAGHPFTDSQAVQAFERQLAPEGDPAASKTLHEDFKLLVEQGAVPADAALLVKRTNVLAETFANRVIIVSDALAKLSQEERLFVLAHEGSHAAHDDNEGRRLFIEAQVSPFGSLNEMVCQYRAIEPQLQQRARDIEYRADKEAYLALKSAKVNARQGVRKFFTEYAKASTAWHPSSKERLTALLKI